MSKTRQQRLKRLESLVTILSGSGTTAIRKIINVTLWLRTTIAGAQTFNLPAATGKGGLYRFFVGVTATGNKVWKAAGTDTFQGQASVASAGTAGTFPTASNSNTITMNQTTSGGVLGSIVEVWDIAPGVWAVQVNANGTGVATTPFSNT